MAKQQTFTATIQNAGGGGAFVEVPFDVEAAFGSKRPKVRALIEGVPYRGILTRMGTECHLLIVLKEIREKIGKTFGDEVRITVEPDTEPRVIEVPAELKEAFKTEKEAKPAEIKTMETAFEDKKRQLAELEKQCSRRTEMMQGQDTNSPISESTRLRKVALIRKILADDAEIRNHTEPWMAQVQRSIQGAGQTRRL